MQYRNIVFLDHEETDCPKCEEEPPSRHPGYCYNGIVTDRALKLLHHKEDNDVVWRCPTVEDYRAAFEYLKQWDAGEGEIRSESGAGRADWTDTIYYCGHQDHGQEFYMDFENPCKNGDHAPMTYVLTYHVGLSYIGLEEVILTQSDILGRCSLCGELMPQKDMNRDQECEECVDNANASAGF